MRIIDADALKRRAITVRFFGKDIMMVPTAEIDDAPTIDAVEAVRCKDCKYNLGETTRGESVLCNYSTHGMLIERSNEWFCADGERKEE